MRITILLLLTIWCWRVRCQDKQSDLLRLPRRHHSESVSGYKTSVIHPDPNNNNNNNNNRKHSISTVNVQLHTKDNQYPIETEEDDYASDPEKEQQQNKHNHHHHHRRENTIRSDAETGASNSQVAARYAMPPDGFVNQNHQTDRQNQNHQQDRQNLNHQQDRQNLNHQPDRQNQKQNQPRYIPNGYASTPAPQSQYATTPAPISRSNNQYPQHPGSASNVHFISTPAPSHFFSTVPPRAQYVSNPTNYQQTAGSHVQYISAPGPMPQFASNPQHEQHFNQNAQPNNNVRYLPTQQPRIQYASTPAPLVQIGSNEPQRQNTAQVHYGSTPAPNVQYVSTPAPHDHYVSTPINFVSTQSPVQFATSAPLFGTRINNHNQIPSNGEKHMSIDHFDNAMSGVRNPKYAHSTQNIYVSSTSSPVQVSSTTAAPIVHKSNDDYWRMNQNQNVYNDNGQYQQEQQASFANVNNQLPQSVHYQQISQNPNNNFQDQPLNLNAVESANNLVINVVHPNSQLRNHKTQHKNNYQRDTEKDTDVSPSYSNGDYGWKLASKKQNIDSNQQNSVLYPVSSFSNNNGLQSLGLQSSSSSHEYRPYPDNPFLSHISYPSPSPPPKSAALQSINFQSDNSEQQNINVGYSIGFGNGVPNQEMLKADQTIYANRYPFVNTLQGFTTAFPVQNDVVKGVHVSQVDLPEQAYYDSNNPQEYVTNALKNNEKMKTVNPPQFGNGGYAYNVPAPYKISHTLKPAENNNIFQGSPKSINFQSNNPSVVTTYHGNGGDKIQQYKWNNVGPGGEISGNAHVNSNKPLMIDVQSVTPSPIIYVNNHNNDVVTNTPFFFTTQKDLGDGRVLQTFDHANALKNIQPIDISNVVQYSSPTPIPDTSNSVTMAPHYGGASNYQGFSSQLNHLPTSHFVQHYPQEQSLTATNNLIDQGLANIFNNYKPLDHSIFKDRSVVYNMQPLKQKLNYDGSGYQTSFVYNKPREQQNAYESSINNHNIRQSEVVSPVSFIVHHPSDMIGHSSNLETRHSSNMEYVPSETFRHSSQAVRDSQNEQTSAVHVSHVHSDGQTSSNYQHVISHDNSQDRYPEQKHNYESNLYEGRINQHVGSHHLEPISSASDDNFRMINTNQRQNGEDVLYENQNEIDPNTGSRLTTIHGVKVANPYNVDLKLISEMLRGKPAIDDSRLEALRDKMSRLNPIKLDTSALQEVVSKNDQMSLQIDMPDHEIPDGIKNRDYVNYDPLGIQRQNTRDSERQPKNFNVDYSEASGPFQNNFEYSNDQKYHQHAVPMIASEQLQNSIQSVLNSHQIGAVIEQDSGVKSRSRHHDDLQSPESYSRFSDDSDVNDQYAREERIGSASVQHLNSLASEDVHRKHPKPDVEEPYPLLKPPHPPASQRTHKKSEKRPYGTRLHRTLRHRHLRPAKLTSFQEAEDPEEYDTGYGVQTELRPPPVNKKVKNGKTMLS